LLFSPAALDFESKWALYKANDINSLERLTLTRKRTHKINTNIAKDIIFSKGKT